MNVLARLQTMNGDSRWAYNNRWLVTSFHLGEFLKLSFAEGERMLASYVTNEIASGDPLTPVEPDHEVWACGVTYLRSREARKAESATADIYQKVYDAERPEIFFKANGWRVIPSEGQVRIRKDSRWNVPEPEMTLVVNRLGEIVGYCAGNDMSSRDIEGENPLYLPQAKVYSGSCALGPAIILAESGSLTNIPIALSIVRNGEVVFSGEATTAAMKRKPDELVKYLFAEMTFPQGAFVMTGTCIVPSESFTLEHGDVVTVRVGDLLLRNPVE